MGLILFFLLFLSSTPPANLNTGLTYILLFCNPEEGYICI